ncbi:hypothetical protein [Dapis sp. BLCC M229]|uniref:hypothetical protein n=1 Tax=Dapis sp. BLCC M229 TaxID=3400188 RepID=UPI003CF652AE
MSKSSQLQILMLPSNGNLEKALNPYQFWLGQALIAQGLCWEIWYNPSMCIYHKIPKKRLEREYLLPLGKGIGLATCQLRMVNAKNWQKPVIFSRTILGNLRRIIQLFIKYRGQVKSNLISAFELEYFWGSLLSAFYYLSNILKPDNTNKAE